MGRRGVDDQAPVLGRGQQGFAVQLDRSHHRVRHPHPARPADGHLVPLPPEERDYWSRVHVVGLRVAVARRGGDTASAAPVERLADGGTHDSTVPAEHTRTVHAAVPGSEYVELPAGHVMMFDYPEEFTKLVRDFVERS